MVTKKHGLGCILGILSPIVYIVSTTMTRGELSMITVGSAMTTLAILVLSIILGIVSLCLLIGLFFDIKQIKKEQSKFIIIVIGAFFLLPMILFFSPFISLILSIKTMVKYSREKNTDAYQQERKRRIDQQEEEVLSEVKEKNAELLNSEKQEEQQRGSFFTEDIED